MLLYLHIPFCSSRCGYCAFASSVLPDSFHASYMQALGIQLAHELESLEGRIKSVYIGGGTPSLVDSALFVPLFERFLPYVEAGAEMSIEANPNSLSAAWLSDMRALGVNRLSLGVQSFLDDKLAYLEREHRAGEVERAIESAREAGFENLSIDLIYDTPLDTPKRLKEEIARASSLPVSHLSAYSLTLEEGSRFFAQGKESPSEESLAHFVREELASAGFCQYEVSSYARGAKSRHNLGYWRAQDYIGAGAGAVGCRAGERYYPSREVKRYIADPLARQVERLNEEDRRLERLFLGLRSEVGIDPCDANQEKLAILLEEEKVREVEGRIIALDYFLADEIALFLG